MNRLMFAFVLVFAMLSGCSEDGEHSRSFKWVSLNTKALEDAVYEKFKDGDEDLAESERSSYEMRNSISSERTTIESLEKAGCYERVKRSMPDASDRELQDSLEFTSCTARINEIPRIVELKKIESDIQASARNAERIRMEARNKAREVAKEVAAEYARTNGIELIVARDYMNVYYNLSNVVLDVTPEVIEQLDELMNRENSSQQ